MSKVKFEYGVLVMTANVKRTVPTEIITECLNRHLAGDWGDTEDAELNDEGLDPKNPDRLMSVYKYPHYEVWVITEWDRSVTTVLLPEDY